MEQLVIAGDTIRGSAGHIARLKTAVGNKAAGLATVPMSWIPPFVVVTTHAQQLWNESSARLFSELSENVVLEQFIEKVKQTSSLAIVRSSGVEETLNDRGLYESIRCNPTKNDVFNTINNIWSTLASDQKKQQNNTVLQMALIIQPLIDSHASGHLSNERRVSQRITNWVCEPESPEDEQEYQAIMLGIRKSTILCDPLSPCKDESELLACLRSIAACSCSGSQRVHYEWVWDGSRVWVVQKDLEEDYKGSPPCNGWVTPYVTDRPYVPKVLLEASGAKGGWKKIDCVRVFKQCSMPTTPLFVLENAAILEGLANDIVNEDLIKDLRWLCIYPIVIRTDIARGSNATFEMLPRTDCVRQPKEALEFLKLNATKFGDKGLGFGEFCFIFHRFIPSKACAYSFSRPGFSRVRIDSTWGLPDSLFYYPHDSYEVDVNNLSKIKHKIRCKNVFLDLAADGKWSPRRTGRPYDWKSSLSDSFLREIAKSSSLLSNHLNKDVEIMYFVDNDSTSGHPPCLPWIFTTEVMPKANLSQSIRKRDTTSFFLSDTIDLSILENILCKGQFDDKRSSNTLLIKLKPRGEFVRSPEFLTSIIELIRDKNCIVELEGSILTHSYYLLARNKIPIKNVDPFDPEPRIRRFGKLVRDRIPVRIESHGEKAITYRSSPQDLVHLLKAKAVEESFELFWENNPERMFEELADLLEVISSICEVRGKKLEELLSIAAMKRDERGGFKDGIVLVETQEVPLIGRTPSEKRKNENQKNITLFKDDYIIESKSEKVTPPQEAARWDLDYHVSVGGRSFTLPLVPPDIFCLNKTRRIPIPGSLLVIEVTYQEKRIVLSLRRKASRPPDTKQLKLFDI